MVRKNEQKRVDIRYFLKYNDFIKNFVKICTSVSSIGQESLANRQHFHIQLMLAEPGNRR